MMTTLPALFVDRSEWGATRPSTTAHVSTSITPRGVTVHWEGPGMGTFDHAHCDDLVRGIQRIHVDRRGWDDIAYTAIVCPHGYTFDGRGPGHRTAANGTNAGNDGWYAVCALVGQGDPIPPELLQGIVAARDWLRSTGAGTEDNAHRDHKPTDCPGDWFYSWVHDGMPLDGARPAPAGRPPRPSMPGGQLRVDGILGPKTISALQRYLGTPVDGVISRPRSLVIEALQRMLNRHGARLRVDGILGPKTISALQRYLGTPVDGFLSSPSSTVIAELQRRLNAGRL